MANSNGEETLSAGEVLRLLSDDLSADKVRLVQQRGPKFRQALDSQRLRFEDLGGAGLETTLRATTAGDLARSYSEHPGDRYASWTSRLDRVLLHRIFGPIALILLGFLVIAGTG